MNIKIFLLYFAFTVSSVTSCQSRWSKKSVPVLEFEPKLPDEDSTLIWFKASNSVSVQYWVDALNKFTKPYLHSSQSANVVQCNNLPPQKGQACDFKLEHFGPCTPKYSYGYDHGSPCIFLRLSKVPGWIPQIINVTNIPPEMPEYLRYYIKRSEMMGEHHKIWVSCDGENAADMENLGPMSFYPYFGFQQIYFPYTNVEGYLSPLVAVQFENPKRGVLINIECKVWAKNIPRDRQEKLGLVQFSLMID